MWMRFAGELCCPSCEGDLDVHPFECTRPRIAPELEALGRERGVFDSTFNEYVESGVLLCHQCKGMFPILGGLPVLLTYATPIHEQFLARYAGQPLRRCAGYAFPRQEPASGEREVMASFSEEWRSYRYDGVIWEMSYEDHERRFLEEVGSSLRDSKRAKFLEVGCGLGITTYLAHKNSGSDAVGLDLSHAVWKASAHYRTNPFVHFVQASVFAMPFPARSFNIVYSRGVLHHTESTSRAFRAVAKLCREGGTLYVWVYGTGSIRETLFRRAVYGLERVFRPALSAAPSSLPARTFLGIMGTGYVFFNGLRRMFNASVQPLDLARGVHAARDRFTPRYAHRHEVDEVTGWFRDAGFERTEVVDWRTMPPADRDDFRRNVGVRGEHARSAPTDALE